MNIMQILIPPDPRSILTDAVDGPLDEARLKSLSFQLGVAFVRADMCVMSGIYEFAQERYIILLGSTPMYHAGRLYGPTFSLALYGYKYRGLILVPREG